MRKAVYLFFVLILLQACSTKRNTLVTRSFHNLTAHYNIYFNGNESFKEAMRQLDASHKDNFAEILPLFNYKNKKEISSLSPQMDKTIKKSLKVIKMHSLKAKPKRPKNREMTKKEREFYAKKEFNKWIDDSYFLIGKANFYKQDYAKAINSFNEILNLFKNENSYYPARLWLLKTYIESSRFKDAREQIAIIENDRKFPDKLEQDFLLTKADFYLEQNKYQEAIPILEELSHRVKKKKRARLYYILAQLNALIKEKSKASDYFAQVIDSKASYEMLFNAQINRALLLDANQNSDKLENDLLKMLKDKKNADYKAQIYFALAKIAQTQKDETKALDYFKLCLESPDVNDTQKALAYLALGDMYFAESNYLQAGAYYDSTMSFLSPKYSRYEELSEQTRNLKELIRNLNIIQQEDSLQNVARMPEKQRKKLIESLIQKVKQKEAEEKRTLQGNRDNFDNAPGGRTTLPGQGGKWYFYNQTSISYGSQEFKKRWGNRKLEDHWRRSNKKSVAADFWASQDESQEAEQDNTMNNKKPDYYLKNLPLTDSAMAVSDEKIAKALFKAGDIYYQKLNEPELCSNEFSKLVKRYPSNDLSIEAAYKLYLLYKKEGNANKANYWKKFLMVKYPQSTYARILKDPDYLKQLNNQERAAEELYQSAYADYEAKRFDMVLNKVKEAESKFLTHKLMPKFRLLGAMAVANQGNATEYINRLEYIAKHYPGTIEKKRADEILKTLMSDKNNAASSIEQAKLNKAKQIYTFKPESIHFILFVPLRALDINRFRFDLFNVSVDKYSELNLEVLSVPLTEKQKLIVIKSIKNLSTAQQITEVLVKNLKSYKKVSDYDTFIISQNNFLKLKENKEIDLYEKFYKEFYVK